MAVYKMTEWQSTVTELWYCNDVSNISGGSGNWWNAARACNIPPAAFVEMLVSQFHPDYCSYSEEKNFLYWAWKDKESMRKFKNYINRKARENNFQI